MKQIIEKGLAQRDAEKISLRWPLSEIKIFVKSGFGIDKFSEIIKSQLNVKEIKIMPAKETELTVEINTKITPELEAEGFARELSRKIQSARKNASLKKEDRIIIAISSEFNDKLKNQLENLKEKIGAEEISLIKNKQKYDYSEEGKIKDKNFFFSFSKKNIVDKS